MCDNTARYRFTWPGRDESVICEEHVGQLKGVANAIGLHLQVIPLSENDLEMELTCQQEDGKRVNSQETGIALSTTSGGGYDHIKFNWLP